MSDLARRIAELPRERLLLLYSKLQERLQAQEDRLCEPIAVVGAACRFPQAPTPDDYWKLLAGGRQTVTEVPPERWDVEAHYSADSSDERKMYSRHGSFLEGVEDFDYQFFGVSRREAVSMDPQQRLLLEVSWEALERAGLAGRRLEGSATGVFLGVAASSYAGAIQGVDEFDAYAGTGNALCVAAGRVSYCLGLTGPSVALDTACSSSLVAIDLACRSLRDRQCDRALAGGANLTLAPEVSLYFCKFQALSRSGACHTFDAAADGYVRGEGAGIVVLKRLSDALRDNDRVAGVILGSAVGHDGRTSGLTVPSRQAQADVIRRALSNARLPPAAIQYLEAHGTGTALGDPIELQALGDVFGEAPRPRPLLVASVKTNVGHTESASGVAGVLKVLLALQHRQIPPHLNFRNPNPLIPWKQLPVEVPVALTPWTTDDTPRTAGVSSFGFSGSNAHVILREHVPAAVAAPPTAVGVHPLCISARSSRALARLAADLARELETRGPCHGAVCHTLLRGRRHFPWRRAAAVGSTAEAAATLRAWASDESPPTPRDGRLLLLFPPLGRWTGFGRQLALSEPRYGKLLADCNARLSQRTGKDCDLSTDSEDERECLLREAAARLCLVELLAGWGLQPAAVCGWGGGESMALLACGQLDWNAAVDAMLNERLGLKATAVRNVGDPRAALIDAGTGEMVRRRDWEYAVPALASGVQTLPPGLASHIQSRGYNLVLSLGDLASPKIGGSTVFHVTGQGKDPDDLLLANALASLYQSQAAIDWEQVGSRRGYQTADLPTYPFERERCWRRAASFLDAARQAPAADAESQHAVGGERESHFILGVRQVGPPSHESHVVSRSSWPAAMQAVGPLAQSLIASMAAAAKDGHANELEVSVQFEINEDQDVATELWTLVAHDDERTRLELWRRSGGEAGGWRRIASGERTRAVQKPCPATPRQLRAGAFSELAGADHYRRNGGDRPQQTRVVDRVWRGEEHVVARLRLPEIELKSSLNWPIHPLFLQAALDFVPSPIVGMARVHCGGQTGPMAWCCVERVAETQWTISLFDLDERLSFYAVATISHAHAGLESRSPLARIDELRSSLAALPALEQVDDWSEVNRLCRETVLGSLPEFGELDAEVTAAERSRRAGVEARFVPWVAAVQRRMQEEGEWSDADCQGAGTLQRDGRSSVVEDVARETRLAAETLGRYLRGETDAAQSLLANVMPQTESGAALMASGLAAAHSVFAVIRNSASAERLHVLELNAGLGLMTAAVQPAFDGCEYDAADESPLLLSLAEQRLGSRAGLRYVPLDPLAAPSRSDAQRYDVVLCFTPWYLADDPVMLLLAAARRLKPGGVVVVALPTGQTPWLDLQFALSQIGLRPAAMALTPGHDVHGPWNEWSQECGFSCPIVHPLGSQTAPKCLFVAQLERIPPAEHVPPPNRDLERQLSFWREAWRAPEEEFERRLLDRMRGELAELLNDRGPESVDCSRSIAELGLDSLMALELQRRADPVQRWLTTDWRTWSARSLRDVAAGWAASALALRTLALS